MSDDTVNLDGREMVDDDPAMAKVLSAQTRLADLRRLNAALKKDRDLLLSEYSAARSAREVPTAPTEIRKGGVVKKRVSFGDVHGMLMDRRAVRALLDDLKQIDPDEIVILGDLLECGGFLAQHQPIGFVANCDYSYQEDVKAANWVLDQVQKAAPRAAIHYIEGNHEDRVERWIIDEVSGKKRDAAFLLSVIGPKTLLYLEERGIRFYGRHGIHGKGLQRGWIELDKMHFTHSLTYSKNAARDAALLTAGDVTYGCTHRRDAATVVFAAVGQVMAYNPGCLSSMVPIYMHSHPSGWSQGYQIEYVGAKGNSQVVQVPICGGRSALSVLTDSMK